jgi:uncharacterized protein
MNVEEFKIPCNDYSLRVRRAIPDQEKCALILAHGAGAGMNSPFMETFQEKLAELGIRVTEFNFSYKEAGKKAPSSRKVLEAEWQAVIENEIKSSNQNIPTFIGGKSMGGRISSYIIAEFAELSGLVFLGYPLHPPGKTDKLRSEHLFEINKPMLFISGTKDRLAQLDLLKKTTDKLGENTTLHLVENGDHSLQIAKKFGSTPDVWQQSCEEIAKWMENQN